MMSDEKKSPIISSPPLTILKGVGNIRVSQFARLGITTPKDLLTFYPKSYEDWSTLETIMTAPIGTPVCIKVYPVTLPKENRIRKGLSLYKFTVTDGEFDMNITIFNNKYAAAKIKMDTEYLFYGQVSGNLTRREMSSPLIEFATTGERIRPIYPQTEGLSTRMIENAVAQALVMLKYDLNKDPIPADILQENDLCSREFAINNIHFPSDNESLKRARRRLAFEELFILQLGLLQLRARSRSDNKFIIKGDLTEEFEKLLPFKLTGAQSRTICECISDMQGDKPMNRLIQGDVGSGKTAIAAACAYKVIKSGYQVAMMAPTEILAEQHANTLSKMFEGTEIVVGILTGSLSAPVKREVLQRLSNGEINLIVGTHALISKGVEFEKLGLIITDEQHRFGVNQRATLAAKSDDPHTLVMSATPIPRTLALIVYGDLDVSILDELPPGRTPVETFAISGGKRERAFKYVKKHLDEGLQGYIVCPLVEDPEEESDLVSATEYAQKLLATSFKGYKIGLLHGRMKSAEKEEVMKAFTNNVISLLVSTTVIEVGVDIPNAAIMVIENAERFGLAQLHQLRGRVGRGKHASTCILISDAKTEEATRRLKTMCSTNDGFKIADEDLKMRGPGDFFGNRQHGLPDLKIASLTGGDMELFQNAQEKAREILSADPVLLSEKNHELSKAVKALFENASGQAFN